MRTLFLESKYQPFQMSLWTDEKKIFFKFCDSMYMSPKTKLWLFQKPGVDVAENELFYLYINVSPKSE